MKRLVVENKGYCNALIGIISLFFIYNLYATIQTKSIIGLSPILIQGIVLYILISKNRYTKVAVKIWAGLFLIGSGGLVVIGILLEYLGRGKEELFSTKFIIHVILILIGILIFALVKDLGIIKDPENI